MTDDLGYGDLSFNRGQNIKTPNIDSLFNSGVVFINFYSNSPVCSPTRASLLTGKYPDMVGVPGVIRKKKDQSWGYFKEDELTLPKTLKNEGYNTALIGKWHLGVESPNLPNQRGFTFFHGFLSGMMDDYYEHLQNGEAFMRRNYEAITADGHATEVFSNWAIKYINDNAKLPSPFFMLLSYNAPHYPIQPPNKWYSEVKKRDKSLSEKRAKYVALVEHLDHEIGRVIETLKTRGMYENTIIVFTSDNGGHIPSGASNGKLRGSKTDMYEGGIKVPTCLVWKNKIKTNSETDILGITMDLYPTLLGLSGVEINHVIDGINLLQHNNESLAQKNRTIFFVRRSGYDDAGLSYYAARQGDFKLVQNTPFESMQLFNISTDPFETNPLDSNHKMFKMLRYDLSQHIRKSGKIPWQRINQ
ncbi:MAG: sulfatase-like hydrolase/transferase [Crocinitomicaceae bacterium]|nr:sulfatase-like hydrolase/transferase [Crocinitomicaceae bacterium]